MFLYENFIYLMNMEEWLLINLGLKFEILTYAFNFLIQSF